MDFIPTTQKQLTELITSHKTCYVGGSNLPDEGLFFTYIKTKQEAGHCSHSLFSTCYYHPTFNAHSDEQDLLQLNPSCNKHQSSNLMPAASGFVYVLL